MQRTSAALLLMSFGNSMSLIARPPLDGAPSPLATMEKKRSLQGGGGHAPTSAPQAAVRAGRTHSALVERLMPCPRCRLAAPPATRSYFLAQHPNGGPLRAISADRLLQARPDAEQTAPTVRMCAPAYARRRVRVHKSIGAPGPAQPKGLARYLPSTLFEKDLTFYCLFFLC